MVLVFELIDFSCLFIIHSPAVNWALDDAVA